MKLIIGLGNPGKVYASSRHNIGFLIVTELAKCYGIQLKKGLASYSLAGKGKIDSREVILAEPLTFMNLSGNAVLALVKKHKIDIKDILVLCDDLDLRFGRLRIRKSGSSGGHRGLNSIINSLKTRDFSRLRIGIGRPQEDIDVAEYVLDPFNKAEKKHLSLIINTACECVRDWVIEGIDKTMNLFNRNALTLFE